MFKLGMMTYVLKWTQITTIQNFYHLLIEYFRKHERYWTAFSSKRIIAENSR